MSKIMGGWEGRLSWHEAGNLVDRFEDAILASTEPHEDDEPLVEEEGEARHAIICAITGLFSRPSIPATKMYQLVYGYDGVGPISEDVELLKQYSLGMVKEQFQFLKELEAIPCELTVDMIFPTEIPEITWKDNKGRNNEGLYLTGEAKFPEYTKDFIIREVKVLTKESDMIGDQLGET